MDLIYRHDAFSAGLKAAGYEIQSPGRMDFRAGDVVLGWHRYGSNTQIANRVEAAGGVYICAENGYIGRGGASPHSMEKRDPYALARGWHNDSTVIRSGGPERWDALGIELKPWRTEGGHVLICPNRPFGAQGRTMPADWAQTTAAALAKTTKREIRIRAHPGNHAPVKPLQADLEGAHACVIWSSSAGVHALVAGIPVICHAPFWVAKESAFGVLDSELDSPNELPLAIAYPDTRSGALDFSRQAALTKLSWGQWFTDEIASGAAFRAILA